MTWIPCVIILLLMGTTHGVHRGTAIANGMAKLKCHFKISNFTILRMYWQTELQVVYEMLQGKEEQKHISKNFLNLTKNIQRNGDLHLYNISKTHAGTYECIIFENTSKDRKHHSYFDLDVVGNYSVPEIKNQSSEVAVDDVFTVENGTTVALKCTSSHGFPKPKNMFWKLFYGNRSKERVEPCEIKNFSEAFNISSNLVFKVEEDVNITCVLNAHHQVVSQILQIVVKKHSPEAPDQNLIIIISLFILVSIMAVALALLITNCKKRKQSSSTSRTWSNTDPETITGSTREQELGLMSRGQEEAT